MTVERTLDHQLSTWLDDQAASPPADLLSRSLARIERKGQRPGFLTRDRYTGRALRFGDSPLLVPVVLLFLILLSAAIAAVGSQLVKPRLTLVGPTEGIWQPSDQVAFRAQLDPALEIPPFKWRAGAYAEYTTLGWLWGDVERHRVPAGQSFVAFSPEGDAPSTIGRRRVQITITPEAFGDRVILGPNRLASVDKAANAIMVGADGWYASIETSEGVGVGPYTVSALIAVPGVAGGLSEARLRSAGTDYSMELLATYTALPDGALGPASTALLEDILGAVQVPDGADPDNAYDLARTMESYLRDDDNFAYNADVRDLAREHCAAISTVECFVRIRQGYCEYYASTMAVLLRASGIPARIAYGFLPGERDGDGAEVVGAWAAHWWVEVYFPGEVDAWVEFDPTGGGVGQPQALPSGSPPPS